jgi:hypothetical protein
MATETEKPTEEAAPEIVEEMPIKERFFHTRVVYDTILYIVNKELIRDEYPDPYLRTHNELLGICYQKDINLLGSVNFIFSQGTTDLETFG